MYRSLFLLFYLFFFLMFGALGKTQISSDSLTKIDSIYLEAERNIIPFVIYSNETSVGTGVVYSYYFPSRSARKVSNIQTILMYTLKNQLMLNVVPEYFTLNDRFKYSGAFQLSRYPNVFFGIGNDVKDSDEEDYTPNIFKFSGSVQRYWNSDWKAGVSVLMRYEDIQKREKDGKLDRGNFLGQDPYWSSGIGLSVVYDCRDNIFMSRDGSFAEVIMEFYHPWMGSDLEYQILKIDLRHFFPLAGRRSLAFQSYLWQAWGDVPFQELPMIGGYQFLRGFLEGKYRDDFMGIVQGEFRYGIRKRWGGVAFLSAGNVAPKLQDFDFTSLKVAGGLGLRYRLNENQTQLRLDVGLNNEGGSGVYFTILEAF